MPAADIILKNARVITMAAAKPAAELVAISGDKIALAPDGRARAVVAVRGVVQAGLHIVGNAQGAVARDARRERLGQRCHRSSRVRAK